MTLLQLLNTEYLDRHEAKEWAFWKEKMALSEAREGEFEAQEKAFIDYVSRPRADEIDRELKRDDLEPDERTALLGWKRYFKAHAMENAEARKVKDRIVDSEGKLARARGAMKLGYTDPGSGRFENASSIKLGLMMRTSSEEALRQAAYEALMSIEETVLTNGFLDIVKERNRLGRMLGYEDYYDWRVQINEGITKRELFAILEDLEHSTREACAEAVAKLEKEKGPQARKGWNFSYLTSGDVTQEMDPYFGFEEALPRWGRCFAALGIRYRGATLTLDLLDRKGKYENGFMHGPVPAFRIDGRFRPAAINFTSNAIPGQVGSGHRALETLFHEGGHAAHFSNIDMPAPCFSQEYAPTSVGFAETQSMFLDSFIDDAEWQARYARDKAGNPIPWDLVAKNITCRQPYRVFQLRAMLTVCFAEKALYEMPESELTPDRVRQKLREVEQQLQFLDSGVRPVLSVPHLLSGESSAYYHGYVLAEMAVHQTREYFLARDGHLLDNPGIGSDLAKAYWSPGNSRTFFEFVEALTGKPLSPAAITRAVSKPLNAALEQGHRAYQGETSLPRFEGKVDLEADIRLIHGDETIARLEPGGDFEAFTQAFRSWLTQHRDG